MAETKFYLCNTCKNLAGLIHASGVRMQCCGKPMEELTANTVEASVEKHIPVVSIDGKCVKVAVGDVEHPMIDEHYIQWIYVQTSKGGQRKALNPGDKPEAIFTLTDELPEAVFAYCNLHGLWKAEI